MRHLKIIILILFSTVIVSGADPNAFSEMAVTVQINRGINRTPFHQSWQAGDGFSLFYRTPFMRGILSAGLAYTPYHGKTIYRPDYQSYFISMGWLYYFPLPFNFQLMPGVRFGNYLMNFDIESGDNKYESEISYEIFCFLEKPVNEQVLFNVEISRQIIFTYEVLTFSHIKAGLTFNIDDSNWLGDILR
ncbi:MAG: hypothetical protein ACLFQM_11050 [Fidelibacterota bacterium]